MTTPQYKYIEGREVLCDEHMLSATEIAKLYGITTANDKPNGALVCNVLADYINSVGASMPEYYYPHSHGVMKVYPRMLYTKALNDFTQNLHKGEKYMYMTDDPNRNKKKIIFKYD